MPITLRLDGTPSVDRASMPFGAALPKRSAAMECRTPIERDRPFVHPLAQNLRRKARIRGS
jgi:hypothetical protein